MELISLIVDIGDAVKYMQSSAVQNVLYAKT
jgi:hypothetical protein